MWLLYLIGVVVSILPEEVDHRLLIHRLLLLLVLLLDVAHRVFVAMSNQCRNRRALHDQYGHLQEIVRPYRRLSGVQAMLFLRGLVLGVNLDGEFYVHVLVELLV